ncbi:MAG: tRNA 2-selenouridine(34) synthase MnmH [Campylobacterales bacterium]
MNTIKIEQLNGDFSDYDLIIDARSPKEYAESHIPGAINLYALSDEEHSEVGTIYKQVSPFQARVKGASYVCLNAAKHIEAIYPSYTPKARIAIYCARGGMRSSSLATIFSSIGYRIEKLEGGYKSYRKFVVEYLNSFEKINFITLRGYTGCGKSDLLKQLDNVIDLEGMANHYGSVFGAVNGRQPTQKEFQNRLTNALLSIDRSRPVFIEGESVRIGSVMLPQRLYTMMEDGVQVRIDTPLSQRVDRIVGMYEGLSEEYFRACMEKITPYISRTAKERAICSYEMKEMGAAAEILLLEYYDKVYKKTAGFDHEIYYESEQEAIAQLTQIQNALL